MDLELLKAIQSISYSLITLMLANAFMFLAIIVHMAFKKPFTIPPMPEVPHWHDIAFKEYDAAPIKSILQKLPTT